MTIIVEKHTEYHERCQYALNSREKYTLAHQLLSCLARTGIEALHNAIP